MSTPPKQLKSTCRIRFPDCDLMGHLNNSRYLDYFLNAREDHLREGYSLHLTDFLEKGVFWVVTQHEILYKRPALYNEVVCIVSALIGMDAHSLRVEMQMWNEAQTELKSVMWTHFTLVDGKTGRKSAHPPEFLTFASSILYEGVSPHLGLSTRASALVKGEA